MILLTCEAAHTLKARRMTSTVRCDVRTFPPITAAPSTGSNTLPGGTCGVTLVIEIGQKMIAKGQYSSHPHSHNMTTVIKISIYNGNKRFETQKRRIVRISWRVRLMPNFSEIRHGVRKMLIGSPDILLFLN